MASGIWNIYQDHEDTIAKAKIEANSIFDHNIAYRKWSTMHGGIYTRISNKDKNNPHFLFNIKGQKKNKIGFAIIDPFQVTKQAYDVLHKQSSDLAAFSHTVSLDYASTMDPYDKPDPWEALALKEFKSGEIAEAATTFQIDNASYLKLIKPYVIDQGCLNCHEGKEFKIGAVHGGMSVAIPMEPYYETAVIARRTIIVTHVFLLLLGCLAIIKFSAAFRKYQTTIIENEEKFRIVSEFAYNFEYWISEDNQLAFISPSCERLTGYSREMFLKNPQLLTEMIHPDDIDLYRNHLIKVDDPEHNGTDFRIIRKDGEVRWFTHTCSPIYIDGQFLGRRSSSIDVTEHKKLEEQLSRTQRLEDLGQFSGGIAHDFNNVLTSITTFNKLLADEISGNKTAADYIKYINIAAKLGKNLTSNLLSFGKSQVVSLQKESLHNIIIDISDILKSLINEDIKLNIHLGKEELEISADRHQVEQILINLCTNARDAMPSGGDITITTKTACLDKPSQGCIDQIPTGRFMVLNIADKGFGISQENIHKICEPFFTTKGPSKGTGLGLSITHNIIRQHNATLDVQSTINQGTTFSIYFPAGTTVKTNIDKDITLHPLQAPEAHQKPVSLPSHTNKPKLPSKKIARQTKTILVADDDSIVLHSLTITLESLGFKVLTAKDGKKAISIFIDQKDNIDLAVLDIVMPIRNGIQVYDIIHKNSPNLPIIFISGNTENALTKEILLRQDVRLMAKPLDIELFTRTITEFTKLTS